MWFGFLGKFLGISCWDFSCPYTESSLFTSVYNSPVRHCLARSFICITEMTRTACSLWFSGLDSTDWNEGSSHYYLLVMESLDIFMFLFFFPTF